MTVFELIQQELTQVLIERGAVAPVIGHDTLLLNGPLEIDSLDLATLVVTLEEKTGKTPFAQGFVLFHTVGDLAKLFGD